MLLDSDLLDDLARVNDCQIQHMSFEILVDWESEDELLAILEHLDFPFTTPFLELIFTDYGLKVVKTHWTE